MDRGCLLHRLPQLSKSKVAKPFQSRSCSVACEVLQRGRRSESRVGRRAPSTSSSGSRFLSNRRVIEVNESDCNHMACRSGSNPKSSGSTLEEASVCEEPPAHPEVAGLIEEDDVEAQLNKDSSDDENIELYVPPELMNSMLE